jgi:hypothetical protein
MTGHPHDTGEHDFDGHDTGMRAEDLDFPACFLLWSMRTWLMAHRQECGHGNKRGRDRVSAYRGIAGEAFLRAGVPQGLELIDDVFSALAVAALRPIDLRCQGCVFVSPDEALLLGAVAASQRKHHGTAWSALTALLPPAAARAALPSLIALATLLRGADLILKPLDAEKCAAPDLRIALAHSAAAAPIH